MRYAAFISYNRSDKKIATWLHAALETYRIPSRLRGRPSPLGELGARLPPVFRDREELAATADLAETLRDALADSSSLIVICSPDAARSKWVNEEIRAFTALGRRGRIQCLIASGVSHASRTPGADPATECLPPALLEGGAGEPLAADIRPGRGTRSEALLKLIAGLLAMPYDELRQREQARKQRRLMIASMVLGAGLLVTSGLAVAAFLERNDAVRQRDLAQRKTMTAERTVEFVKSMFEVADPSEARGATITAREILDRGAAEIEHGLNAEPSVKAELQTTLGEVYGGLGLDRQSEAIIRRGLAVKGVDPSTRAREYTALGEAVLRRGEYAEALGDFAQALRLVRGQGALRADLIPRILVGEGEARSESGDISGASRVIANALRLDLRDHGPLSPEVARDLETLGPNEIEAHRLDLARETMEHALAIRLKTQGPLHPRTAEDLNTLGAIAYLQHDPVAAEDYDRRALTAYRAVLGDNHPETATTMNNLALLKLERRDFKDAEPLLEQAVAINVAQRSATFDDLAFEYENLGRVKRGLGDTAAAETLFEKALVVARLHRHRNLGPILVDLADMACARGDTAAGFARLAEARGRIAADYPADPWRMAWLEIVDSGCLAAAGKVDAARIELRRAMPILLARWPPGTVYAARAQQLLARTNRAPRLYAAG
jgi:tetratricopeptide (TPR) repeat protein